MPTFPLPTLAFQVTPTGIAAPSFNDILQSLTASFLSIYGSDALLTPDTQDGQWIAINALGANDLNQSAIALYNSFNPLFAQGIGLSSLAKIVGLRRQVATESTAAIRIVGVSGTVITNGVVQDINGNLWSLPTVTTIPAGSGNVVVTATAQSQGAIVAPVNTINIIANPQLGWQSANNEASAVIGAPVETDAALRIRIANSTGLPGITPRGSIQAAVANIVGVSEAFVYENNTSITDANGVPSHSISLVVSGGDLTAIATAVENKKAPGIGTFGSTSVTVFDPGGVPAVINFYILATVNVFVSVQIHPLVGYTATVGTAIVNAIITYINALAIGTSVHYNSIFGPASLYGAITSSFFTVTSITIGFSASPVGTTDLAIAFNQAAFTDATKVVLTVV